MLKSDEVRRVLWVTLFLNLAVAAIKIAYGTTSRTQSMFADGFHSLFDGTSNVLGLVGLWIASQPADANHPYGHKKYETFATIGIAVLLLLAGYQVVAHALVSLFRPIPPQITPLSFGIMIGTLLVNLGVSSYEARAGKRLKSDFLLADSRHTASDVLTSLGVIAAMAAAALGYPILDPLAALLIAGVIVRMAILVVKESSDVLCDAARIDTRMLEEIVGKAAGVRKVHDVRTRGRADAVHVDLSVHVDPKMPTDAAHDLVHRIETAIRGALPEVAEILVHVEPEGH